MEGRDGMESDQGLSGGGKRFKVGRVELHFPPSPPQRRITQSSCSRSLKINATEVGKFCSFREVDSLQD